MNSVKHESRRRGGRRAQICQHIQHFADRQRTMAVSLINWNVCVTAAAAVQGEVAEERFMMRRTREENSFLRSFVVRYRSHVGDLQAMQLDLPDRAQRIISDMHGLSDQADTLMGSHDRLWQAYTSLPNTPR